MDRSREALERLGAAELDLAAFGEIFEESDPAERVRITRAIDGRTQARLWEATAGSSVSIAEMVPPDLGPLRPVVFHGKNSLLAFTHFEKRFCRAGSGADELWGYNHQPTRVLPPLIGPGYFVAVDADAGPGRVAIDYTRIPPDRPPGWPAIHDNSFRLSRFVYRGMIDYLRRVSAHLLIGRATRAGRELPNYFLLCREDPT